jgi:hypothetical protein
MNSTRIRTGIELDEDGWQVIIVINHEDGREETRFINPTGKKCFDSENEAWEASKIVAKEVRKTFADHGQKIV